MGRFTTLIGSLVIVLAACSAGSSPSSTPAPSPSPAAVATPSQAATTPTSTAAPVAVAVTFDGKTCAYTGPAVFPLGTNLTFTLTNTPAVRAGSKIGGAALLVGPVVAGTTWEQILANKNKANDEPAWLFLPSYGDSDVDIMYPSEANSGYTLDTTLTHDNSYVVLCNTAPEDSNTAYPAILLKVLKG